VTVGEDPFLDGTDPELAIVTVQVESERAGCLVSFSTRCSIHPPRYLVCLSVANHTCLVAKRAGILAVHRLSRDQGDLARIFGELTGDEHDKFARCRWTRGVHGAPILSDVEAWVERAICAVVPFGDHVGFVLCPLASGGENRVAALRARDLELSPGHPVG